MFSNFPPLGRLYAAFASLVILIVLGLQLVVGFTFHRADYWPFVSYPMYSGARYDGQRFAEYRLFAETTSGERIPLDAEDFGYSFWLYRKNVHEPVLKGRVPEALLTQACARHGGIRELVLEDTGYFITRNGPETGPPEEKGRLAVTCPGQEADE